jgi:hemerythrin-like domain-containing protein
VLLATSSKNEAVAVIHGNGRPELALPFFESISVSRREQGNSARVWLYCAVCLDLGENLLRGNPMIQHQVVPAEDAEMIHEEHVELRTNLGELDDAIRRLGCNPEIRADLTGAPKVWSMVRRFQAFLPLHFQHEEKGMLDRVAEVSPELTELTAQLKQEHQNLAELFEQFADAVNHLNAADDVNAEVSRAKLLGEAFTNQMFQHIATEETELAGFL